MGAPGAQSLRLRLRLRRDDFAGRPRRAEESACAAAGTVAMRVLGASCRPRPTGGLGVEGRRSRPGPASPRPPGSRRGRVRRASSPPPSPERGGRSRRGGRSVRDFVASVVTTGSNGLRRAEQLEPLGLGPLVAVRDARAGSRCLRGRHRPRPSPHRRPSHPTTEGRPRPHHAARARPLHATSTCRRGARW